MPTPSHEPTHPRLTETPSSTHAPGSPRPLDRRARRHRDQRGEGVISTAIAVLIVSIMGDAQTKTSDQISQIGGG